MLDTNIIRTKAKKLYGTFTDSDDMTVRSRMMRSQGHRQVLVTQYQAHLMAARAGDKFQKRFGRKTVSMQGEAASQHRWSRGICKQQIESVHRGREI